MDADSRVLDTLHITVNNAVTRMETLNSAADRRCIFNEYKEWFAKDISDDVWLLPANWNQEKQRECN